MGGVLNPVRDVGGRRALIAVSLGPVPGPATCFRAPNALACCLYLKVSSEMLLLISSLSQILWFGGRNIDIHFCAAMATTACKNKTKQNNFSPGSHKRKTSFEMLPHRDEYFLPHTPP